MWQKCECVVLGLPANLITARESYQQLKTDPNENTPQKKVSLETNQTNK